MDFGTAQADRTEGDALTQQRYRKRRAMTTILACGLAALWVLSAFGLQIGHLNSPRLEHRATVDRAANQREREFSDRTVCQTVTGDQEQSVAVAAKNAGALRVAQAGGTLHHCVKHRLQLGRRMADGAQYLAGRGELVTGLG